MIKSEHKLSISCFQFEDSSNDLSFITREIKSLSLKINNLHSFYEKINDPYDLNEDILVKINKTALNKEKRIHSKIRRIFLLIGNIRNNSTWQSMSFEKNTNSKSIFQFKDDLGKFYHRCILTESNKERDFSIISKESKSSSELIQKSVLCSSGISCINMVLSLVSSQINKKGILFPKHHYCENDIIIKSYKKTIFFENKNYNSLLYLLKYYKPVGIFIEPISNSKPISFFNMKKFLKEVHKFSFLKYIIIDTSSIFASFSLFDYEINLNKGQVIFDLKSLQKNFQYGYDLISAGLINIICKKEDQDLCLITWYKLLEERQKGFGLSSYNYYSLPDYNKKINQSRDETIIRNNIIASDMLLKIRFKNFSFIVDSPYLASLNNQPFLSIPFFQLIFDHEFQDSINILFYLIKKSENESFNIGTSFGFNFTRVDILTNKCLRISVGTDNIVQLFLIIKDIENRLHQIDALLNDKISISRFDEIRNLIFDTLLFLRNQRNYENIFEVLKRILFKMAFNRSEIPKEINKIQIHLKKILDLRQSDQKLNVDESKINNRIQRNINKMKILQKTIRNKLLSKFADELINEYTLDLMLNLYELD